MNQFTHFNLNGIANIFETLSNCMMLFIEGMLFAFFSLLLLDLTPKQYGMFDIIIIPKPLTWIHFIIDILKMFTFSLCAVLTSYQDDVCAYACKVVCLNKQCDNFY